jgi:UDP-N-acetylmuramoyl-L-alanyl-D-glutamate--2,6-diaminopimelate ligase
MTLARTLAAMRDRNTSHAAIELSSHALKQGRAAGLMLDVGIITNITQDHFDYHRSFHDYVSAKARIASHIKRGGVLVLNADDPVHEEILERLDRDVRVQTFGIRNSADLRAEALQLSPQGTRFQLSRGSERVECVTPLVGAHNVSNCLAAAAAALHFGLSFEQIAQGLSQCRVVPGRLERVERGQPFNVYVDYAHTDDALRRIVTAIRAITSQRILLVFGAGGDRDKSKRPLMAQAAALADEVIITSDNPRSEDPWQILDDLAQGFSGTKIDPIRIADRCEAIHEAIRRAQPGDAVIIAGKGHEKEQILGEKRLPFDDVAVCHEALTSLGIRPHFSVTGIPSRV